MDIVGIWLLYVACVLLPCFLWETHSVMSGISLPLITVYLGMPVVPSAWQRQNPSLDTPLHKIMWIPGVMKYLGTRLHVSVLVTEIYKSCTAAQVSGMCSLRMNYMYMYKAHEVLLYVVVSSQEGYCVSVLG